MTRNTSLQNLEKQRDDLKRRLNKIEKRIQKHPRRIQNETNFIKDFKEEIRKFPKSNSESRDLILGRLTKEHGKMFSNRFVERSKRHPPIRDVLHSIQSWATNREIDAILRRALVRFKKSRKENQELMSNTLIAKILGELEESPKKNTRNLRRNSIPHNSRNAHEMKKSPKKKPRNERRNSILFPPNLRNVHEMRNSPKKKNLNEERRKSIPNNLRNVHVPNVNLFSPVNAQRNLLDEMLGEFNVNDFNSFFKNFT